MPKVFKQKIIQPIPIFRCIACPNHLRINGSRIKEWCRPSAKEIEDVWGIPEWCRLEEYRDDGADK